MPVSRSHRLFQYIPTGDTLDNFCYYLRIGKLSGTWHKLTFHGRTDASEIHSKSMTLFRFRFLPCLWSEAIPKTRIPWRILQMYLESKTICRAVGKVLSIICVRERGRGREIEKTSRYRNMLRVNAGHTLLPQNTFKPTTKNRKE